MRVSCPASPTLSGRSPPWRATGGVSPEGRLESSGDVGRKHDIPKQRRRRLELDRDERAFLIHLRRSNHAHLDALLRFGIFENELGALVKALGKDDHRAGSAHCMRKSLERLGALGHVGEHGHPQQDTLGAAALFCGGLPRMARTSASYLTRSPAPPTPHLSFRFHTPC